MHIAHLKISKSQCVDIQTPVLENFWILYKRAFFCQKNISGCNKHQGVGILHSSPNSCI